MNKSESTDSCHRKRQHGIRLAIAVAWSLGHACEGDGQKMAKTFETIMLPALESDCISTARTESVQDYIHPGSLTNRPGKMTFPKVFQLPIIIFQRLC